MIVIEKNVKKSIIILWGLLIIAFLPVLSNFTVTDILNYSPKYPLLAACLLWGLYSLKSIVFGLPITILYIGAGIMFPTFWAIVVSYIGLSIEFTITYFIGKKLGIDQINHIVKKYKKADNILKKWMTHIDQACLIFRIIPGPLPLDVMSMLFGAFNMKFRPYLFYSLLGISPGMLLWIFAGNSINNPLSKEFLFPFGIGILIAVLLFICMKYYERYKMKKTDADN